MADKVLTAAEQAQVADFLRALDAASKQSGKDPAQIVQEWKAQAAASDWVMNTGLEGVGAPSTGPPHPPDPDNIDDLFDPTDLGPNVVPAPPLSGVDFGAGADPGPSSQDPPTWTDPPVIDPGPSLPHGAAPASGVGAEPGHGMPEAPVAPPAVPSWTDDPPLDEPSHEPSQETGVQDLIDHANQEQGYGGSSL